MDLLSKLPLVSIFSGLLASAEDPSGPVHVAVKAAVSLVGNDTEKKLAADDALWSDLVTFIKAGVTLGQAVAADVAG